MPSLPLPADLIDVSAAARLLGVHVSCIYRWIHGGKITSWKIGGRRKLSRKDVEAFPQRSGPGQGASIPSDAEALAILRRKGYAV